LEEIHRVRVAAAAGLLVQSGLSVAEIARETGFRSNERLTRVFHAGTGLTPTEYRNRHRN
jgi:transcriptional regulator GlxA family with amidase domain